MCPIDVTEQFLRARLGQIFQANRKKREKSTNAAIKGEAHFSGVNIAVANQKINIQK
jgi:hypothetical protein